MPRQDRESKPLTQWESDTVLALHTDLFMDIGALLHLDLSNDVCEVRRRFKKEGITFLTKTLTAFGKQILSAFQTGVLNTAALSGFRRNKRSGALPCFLFGLTEQVFDKETLNVLHNPSPLAVVGLYQLTAWMGKYKLPFTSKQLLNKLRNWLKVEDELPDTLSKCFSSLNHAGKTLVLAEQQAKELLKGLSLVDTKPRFGPGAVKEKSLKTQYEKYCALGPKSPAERLFASHKNYYATHGQYVSAMQKLRTSASSAKRDSRSPGRGWQIPGGWRADYATPIHRRKLHDENSRRTVCSAREEACGGGNGSSVELQNESERRRCAFTGVMPDGKYCRVCRFRCPEILALPPAPAEVEKWCPMVGQPQVGWSRMWAVDKDSGGPRLIGLEELERIYVQNGIGDELKAYIGKHPLMRGQMNFDNQSVNASLARLASLKGDKATLDMSDASDREALVLCSAILPSGIFRPLAAIRSSVMDFSSVMHLLSESDQKTFLHMTGGKTAWPMKKMAPMGNGYCFPLETFVFWLLVSSALSVVSLDSFEQCCLQVYAYGDDIIMPAKHADAVMEILQTFGLKFNAQKSFTKGPFRESCGMDAFLGVCVTPFRLKARLPLNKLEYPEELVSHVKMIAQLFQRGYDRTAMRLLSIVERALGEKLPIAPLSYGCLTLELPEGNFAFDDPRWKDEKRPPEFRVRAEGPVVVNDRTVNGLNHRIACPSFVLLEKDKRNWYQGKTIKVWRPTFIMVEPSIEDFPEDVAYLRWWIERDQRRDPFHKDTEAPWLTCETGSARRFGLRYSCYLEQVTLTVT